ncbi:unnamed protein product [Spodoptera exigua]|nr:unnamed protein product [Spodoptera exigua]
MASFKLCICFLFSLFCFVCNESILCEVGFCRTYLHETGCTTPPIHCSANNATHNGINLLSPTLCNCCEYCMPLYGEGEHCSRGGPGTGTTVGRCGDGLYCEEGEDDSVCVRMKSDCHTAQDKYDERERNGELGALEQRPLCDGKGKFYKYECVPAQTCYCQSDDGRRLFGEVLNRGAITEKTMHCGCSRFHDLIKSTISSAVPRSIVGPRCTPDGNFFPIRCIRNICYCVDIYTGIIKKDSPTIDLERQSITQLSCYDEDLDLFPENAKEEPYSFTSPCLITQDSRATDVLETEKDDFILDFFGGFPECLPDWTYGRIALNSAGQKVCVDERGKQIENYHADKKTDPVAYSNMDCKCAQTTSIMGSLPEKPICCKNGNFRRIQCRRGMCRCVDSNGKQIEKEQADVTKLSCYKPDWKIC